MGVFFASDLHLGHRLATFKRGFDSVDKHDYAVIESIASRTTKRDLIWILGDIAMDPNKLFLINEIPGTKKMIIGNHDRFPTEQYLKYFKSVNGFVKYKEFWLSHCPIHPQELYGKICIHGHCHKDTNSPLLGYPYFNINWDYIRGAISLEELREEIANVS